MGDRQRTNASCCVRLVRCTLAAFGCKHYLSARRTLDARFMPQRASPSLRAVRQTLFAYATHSTLMSYLGQPRIHTVPDLTSLNLQTMSGKEPMAAAGIEAEKSAGEPLQSSNGDSDQNVILVDYEENDLEDPLNWSPMQKWLTVFAISWMGFVR